MKYHVLTGEDFDVSFLPKVMDVDRECYAAEYVGELSQMEARYLKNPKTFVCVMDGERIAGYINFFPVNDALWEDIAFTGKEIRDDDIMPDEVPEYAPEGNKLFIISVCVREEYRDQKEVIKLLTDSWIAYLNKLNKDYKIEAIAGTAVSAGGRKFLSNCMFGIQRELEDGNTVYICDGPYLEKLLKNDLYFKSYKDDAYLFIPFVDNPKNPKLPKLLNEKRRLELEGCEDCPELMDILMGALDECLQYEYNSDVVHELERVYLGSYELMHTLDLYPEDEEERPHIVGEETVHISLLAHPRSHMYIVMLFIPNCHFSTSQLEDQVCQKFLQIRNKEDKDENGFFQYWNLNEWLKREYGLLQCGTGKSILCMSKKPETEQEFYNILTGESYNSMRQEFHIVYDKLKECARNNRAIYDYYEVYLTEEVVAFVLNDFEEMEPDERLGIAATYVFIVEMIMFQNIALSRVISKIEKALSHEGDVDYDYIMQLNEDYAKTIKFWQTNNFKYFGTRREAQQIHEAFDNDELKAMYQEQQDFLEHMVEVKDARSEHRNGLILNFALFMMAIVETKDYVIEVLTDIFTKVGGEDILAAASAKGTFNSIMFGIGPLVALILYTIKKKRYYENYERLRERKTGKKEDE